MRDFTISDIRKTNKAYQSMLESTSDEGLMYNGEFTPVSDMPLGTVKRHVFDSLKYNGNNRSAAITRIKQHIDFMEDVATEEQMKGYMLELEMLRNGASIISKKVTVPTKSNPIGKEVSDDEWEDAKSRFGISPSPVTTGYILPDGSQLNFSGNGGYSRDIDHRYISSAIRRESRKSTSYPAFVDAILSGAIRYIYPKSFMFGRKPTEEQWDSIYDILDYTSDIDDCISIDLCANEDLDNVIGVQYRNKTSVSRIKNDVNGFFVNNEYPEGNL